MSPMRRLPLILLVALAPAGCREDRPSGTPSPASAPSAAAPATRAVVALGKLRLADETPPDRRPWTPGDEALQTMLRQALVAAGVAAEPPAGDAWALTTRARVLYGLGAGDGFAAAPISGPGAARWLVELKLHVPGEPAPLEMAFDLRDEAAFDGAPGGLPAFLEARLRSALGKLTTALRDRLAVVTQPVIGLAAALDNPDPELRRLAVERLGMMRAVAAVPSLAARVKTEPDRDTTLRLIGTLAEIGDARAADALIARADPKDRELLHAILDALAVMEPVGPAVHDFLAVLAEHDAPEVREMVAQARARMASRRRP